jgi:hypothetical protein
MREGLLGIAYSKCTNNEDDKKNGLVLQWKTHSEQQRHWYAYDDKIAGNVENGVRDKVICGCRALF